MARTSIPVDLFNPGQVFACLGFLEASDVLLGDAEGGFKWADASEARFELHAEGSENPVQAVLEFLDAREPQRLVPNGYAGQPISSSDTEEVADGPLCTVETFPAPVPDLKTLPLRFYDEDNRRLEVTHWCDESSRNDFKLFAGEQRTGAIAQNMRSVLCQLWKARREELVGDPFGVTLPLDGGSFRLDPRRGWTTIDAGYSPNDQKDTVEASPVVELLAAIGLEHARPDEFKKREVRYGVWEGPLRPVLARAALGGAAVGAALRIFSFTLDLSGKNKNVTFSEEETSQ